jgi:phospholipid/cholesterol/gamma-HCH transport system permease protein
MTKEAALTADTIDSVDLQGDWTLKGLTHLPHQWQKTHWPRGKMLTFNGQHIEKMDSAGAWQLIIIMRRLREQGKHVRLEEFTPEHQALMTMAENEADIVYRPLPSRIHHNLLYRVGAESERKWVQIKSFLDFVGELFFTFLSALRKPSRFQLPSISGTLERNGFDAMPIIALLTFLIGVVLAYQFGHQLEAYGANAYIVDVSGLAILREFSPLITSIILAGRTSSSFTAQIGMMKVNEEIDAIRTMGLSPSEWLVLPKIIGMVIALPLLTVWSDVFGILGSMAMAKEMLGINYTDFINRFGEVIALRHYLVGIGKAPVFALIIAAVGCFQGFRVSHSADSVGAQTTRAVVQTIFLIIVADALFSVIFNWMAI